MGDIADMMLEGFLDSETGEVIDGDAPGYPRTKRRPTRAELRLHPAPYKCPVCCKRLRTERGLRLHRQAKHGQGDE